jgi:hypothetical protein
MCRINGGGKMADRTAKQEYTPKGRAKTCPWISLRGKEWKALSEMRDASIKSVEIQQKFLEFLSEFKEKYVEYLDKRLEIEAKKLQIQEQIKN